MLGRMRSEKWLAKQTARQPNPSPGYDGEAEDEEIDTTHTKEAAADSVRAERPALEPVIQDVDVQTTRPTTVSEDSLEEQEIEMDECPIDDDDFTQIFADDEVLICQ